MTAKLGNKVTSQPPKYEQVGQSSNSSDDTGVCERGTREKQYGSL